LPLFLTKGVSMFIPITVGVVISRDNEDVQKCINSIHRQVTPSEIKIAAINNVAREKSIGWCYNKIAQEAETDWVLYLGDDDLISRTYLYNLAVFLDTFLERFPEEDPVCLTTNLTLMSNEVGGVKQVPIELAPTGMWRKDFLLETPFDESLKKWVDTDLFVRAMDLDKGIVLDQTNYGYYYRQHNDNVSGNKFTERKSVMNKLRRKSEVYNRDNFQEMLKP
jgi:glycosyltransferase involved in cell wall biosynthesis